MPTRPSMEPIAYPFALGKHETQRVCHFSGDCVFYILVRLLSTGASYRIVIMDDIISFYLEWNSWVIQIVHLDMSVCGGYDHERESDVH